MKNAKLFALLALISSALLGSTVWAAGYTPVLGSCTTNGMGPGFCSCDLANPVEGASVIHSDSVPCGDLSCSDFLDATGCGGIQSATCVLRNPSYFGDCIQNVTYEAPQATSAEMACNQVLDYLNNLFSAGRDYCNVTQLRQHWQLISF